jgi:hypothetical protein
MLKTNKEIKTFKIDNFDLVRCVLVVLFLFKLFITKIELEILLILDIFIK